MSLADLMRKGVLRGFATATPATPATHDPESAGTVATVATVAVAKSPDSKAANDPVPDSDRHCWPYSSAMNTGEIDAFTARLARFTGKGLRLADAEPLADKLVMRGRDADDRRLCLECAHLAGRAGGSWGCKNWQRAGVALRARDAQLPPELVRRLQRCDGFWEAGL